MNKSVLARSRPALLASLATAAMLSTLVGASASEWRDTNWSSNWLQSGSPERPHYRAHRVAVHKAQQPKQLAKQQAAPVPQPSAVDIKQAVRDAIQSDPSLLRGSLVELLRNDPEIKQILTPPVAANEPARATPVAPPAPAAPAATAEAPTDQRAQVEGIIKNYLLAHPEVLQDAMAALDKKQQEAEAEKARTSIKDNNATLFNSPHQVVLGNPQGTTTVVEFFDYNCGYCKKALPDMLTLLKSDSNIKFVLKEFPVLGEGSVEAAHVAVAARMQDPTGKKYFEFHQKLLGGRGPADKAHALAAAKDAGFDMARIEKDMDSPEVKTTIDENMKLADALGVNGTPSYVIGGELVVGAVGLDALKEKMTSAKN
jgi:protein-disulfide isomerase